MPEIQHFDALVVGAGFGGLYMLYKLRELGLNVVVIDAASGVGGTWYWNRYPGAMSDTESYIYRYSWDKEDLLQYHWKEHYVKQPDVLAYLEHVAERYELKKHVHFNTEMVGAQWEDETRSWVVQTSTGVEYRVSYMVTALGLLSKTNYPAYPGIDTFKGEMYHTGKWPQQHDFRGKRVGVIGNGSTGVQVITAIAKEVKTLTCFQRTPQYSVPSGDGPVDAKYREKIHMNYDAIWKQVKESGVAFGFYESTVSAKSVSAEERERKFEEAWQMGNGFRFMFWTFNDLTTDPESNEYACEFIRKKIRQMVKDPVKAEKLCPNDFYARRPLCDAGYYEQFNRDNVDIVSLKQTPITKFTATGIETSDGKTHELDVIIFGNRPEDPPTGPAEANCPPQRRSLHQSHHPSFLATSDPFPFLPTILNHISQCPPPSPSLHASPAHPELTPPVTATGFDAVDGNYTRVAIKGRASQSLKDYWSRPSGPGGPTTYLGVSVPDFPNLFMITGPNGPFTNIPPTIETHVEWIAELVGECERRKKDGRGGEVNGHGAAEAGKGTGVLEATKEAEEGWTQLCRELSDGSLFKVTDSWIFGANVPGKKNAVMFYFGGLGNYRKKLAEVREGGYEGYKPF